MPGSPVVDVHAHWFPPALVEMARRLIGEERTRVTVGRAPGAGLPVSDLVGQLDHAGIDRQILSPANLLPALPDEGRARSAARTINDVYADLARSRPERFGFFAAVPLPHVDAAITEAGRCLDELGAVGVALGCSVLDRQLDDPAFEPFWRELERRRAVVFLHPVGLDEPILRDYHLDWVVGAPVEDTLAVLRLVLGGVTTRHPSLTFVVPHLGGTVPFLLTRIDRATSVVAPAPDVAIELPVSRHLRSFRFDTSSRNPSALRCAVDVLGVDALVLGTDFPYSLGDELRRNVAYVGDVLTEPRDTAAVLGGTAAKLLAPDRTGIAAARWTRHDDAVPRLATTQPDPSPKERTP